MQPSPRSPQHARRHGRYLVKGIARHALRGPSVLRQPARGLRAVASRGSPWASHPGASPQFPAASRGSPGPASHDFGRELMKRASVYSACSQGSQPCPSNQLHRCCVPGVQATPALPRWRMPCAGNPMKGISPSAVESCNMKQPPNPSIEWTSKGLRPLAAAHVKR